MVAVVKSRRRRVFIKNSKAWRQARQEIFFFQEQTDNQKKEAAATAAASPQNPADTDA